MREAMREDGVVVRQQPWITYALLVLLLSSFAYLRAERSQIDAELGSSLAEAGEYFRAHPYLTVPALLESRVGAPAGRAAAGALPRRPAQPQRAAGSRRHPAPGAGAARRSRGRGRGPPLGAPDTALGHAGRRASAADAPHPRAPARGLAAPAREPLRAADAGLLPGGIVGRLALHRRRGRLDGRRRERLRRAGDAGRRDLDRQLGPARRTPRRLRGALRRWLARPRARPRVRDGRDVPRRAADDRGPVVRRARGGPDRRERLEPRAARRRSSSARRRRWASASRSSIRSSGVALRAARAARTAGSSSSGRSSSGWPDASTSPSRCSRNRLRQDPNDRDAALALWDVASDLGRPAAAALGPARRDPRRGQARRRRAGGAALARARRSGARARRRGRRSRSGWRRCSPPPTSGPRRRTRSSTRSRARRAATGPALASRVARAASSIDPETAAEAAWRALGSVELTLEERQSLEGLLAEVLPRNAEAALRTRAAPVRRPGGVERRAPRAPAAPPRRAQPAVHPGRRSRIGAAGDRRARPGSGAGRGAGARRPSPEPSASRPRPLMPSPASPRRSRSRPRAARSRRSSPCRPSSMRKVCASPPRTARRSGCATTASPPSRSSPSATWGPSP